MKINRILILSILALAIVTMGAVSAGDNMTEDIMSSDNDDILSEEIPHYLEGDDWPSEIEVRFNYGNDEVLKDDPVYFSATLFSGKMDVSIDGKVKTATLIGEDEVDAAYSVPTTGLELGEHVLNVKLSGGEYYSSANKNFTFFIRDVLVNVPESVNVEDDFGTDMSVKVNSADAGKLTVRIDDKAYTADKVSKVTKTYDLKELSPSSNPHIIKVTFTTSNGVVYDRTFTVNATYFQLYDRTLRYGTGSYSFSVPEGFRKDRLNVKIDGELFNFTESWLNNYYNVNLDYLGLGNHSITVSYDGDDSFAPCSASAAITVYPDLTFSDDYITVNETISVQSSMPNSNCTFTVYVDGELYASKPLSGLTSVVVRGLKVGPHKIGAVISGDYSYTYTKSVYVYVDIDGPGLLYVGETGNFIVKFPNAHGNLTVDFGNEKLTGVFINGTANVTIPSTLKVGHYDVGFIYAYENNSFNVSEPLFIEPVFHVPEHIVNGNGAVYMTLPYDDPEGEFVVEIYNLHDKYVLSAKFDGNKASIPLTCINEGAYNVLPKYFDGRQWYYHGSEEMTARNTKLTASDLSMYYKSGSSFKVKVQDYNGKIIKNKYVKFYLTGKTYKVKTNSKGIASLKIGKAPGEYNITAKYGKVKITRSLTVKHAVTLKTVTVKKSAKSLTLKATLKQGKKALKYKKVTFKFNGKKYTAWTNKYGVAKVTIKKAVLKKLKVGKTVNYQATYLKDTVKKSVKVKK